MLAKPLQKIIIVFAAVLGLLACPKKTPVPIPTPPVTVQGGGPRLVEGECETIFNNWNNLGVANNGASPTFTLQPTDPNILCYIDDYHWNNGAGAAPGTIDLKDAAGVPLGPWAAVGTPGQGGVKDANWRATPPVAVALKPNVKYTVVDSNPATWSQNQQSGGLGFSRVWVRPGS